MKLLKYLVILVVSLVAMLCVIFQFYFIDHLNNDNREQKDVNSDDWTDIRSLRTRKTLPASSDEPDSTGSYGQNEKIYASSDLSSLTKKVSRLSRIVGSLSASLDRLWCASQQVRSNGGFCVYEDSIFTGGNFAFDLQLCTFVEELAGNSSIGDFGAGLGYYGMCFLRMKESPYKLSKSQQELFMSNYKNIIGEAILDTPRIVYSWNGYDGALNIDTLSGGFVRSADLSTPGLWLGRKWDWILSVEVGEHIAADREAVFLDNLVRHACKGIILTWAVEGQPGHHHVNNHNNDYIKRKMLERGLRNDIEAEQQLKEFLNYVHLRETSMIFRMPTPTDCLISDATTEKPEVDG